MTKSTTRRAAQGFTHQPRPDWLDLTDTPQADLPRGRLNAGQYADRGLMTHSPDAGRLSHLDGDYPGTDDDRTQQDLWAGKPQQEFQDTLTDFWITSKTPKRHAKLREPDKYATRYTPVLRTDGAITATDLNGLATFAATLGIAAMDQLTGLVRTWLRALRCAPNFETSDRTPIHITYRAVHLADADLRAAAIRLEVALLDTDIAGTFAHATLQTILKATL